MSGGACISPNQCFPELRWRGSNAVIGVPRKYGGGPINLFQKHDANHLVRPSSGAERNVQFCLAPQIGRKSVRAANHENSIGTLCTRQTAKMPGKSCAVDAVAALVERYQHRFSGNCRRYSGGFVGHPGCGVAGATFGNFLDLKAAKTEFAADIVKPLTMALGHLPLRALLQPAD